jgi:FkbM family methyltransferase
MLELKLQVNLWSASIARPTEWGQLSEAIIETFYRAHLRPGDLALDVGGNVGRHTIPMAEAVGPEGHVHVVEPIPYIADRMQANLEKAGVAGRVSVLRAAASHAPGQARFHVVVGAEPLSSLSRDMAASRNRGELREIVVEVVTIDQRFGALPLRFVKLDVEGAEFDAMKGAAGLLRTARPVLAFEDGRARAAQHFGYSLETYYRFFDAMDYVVLDLFGLPVGIEHGRHAGPWNFFAAPREAVADVRDLVQYASFSVLLERLRSDT